MTNQVAAGENIFTTPKQGKSGISAGEGDDPKVQVGAFRAPIVESEFKSKGGRILWGLLVDVRLKVEARSKAVAELREVIGANADRDQGYREQVSGLERLRMWQSELDAKYQKAVVEFKKMQINTRNGLPRKYN